VRQASDNECRTAETSPARARSQPRPHVASGDGGRGQPSSLSPRLGAGLLHAGLTFGLLALICTAYRPSLRHTHRADDWCFHLDTIDLFGFLDIFILIYLYNCTRMVLPGDYQLFRPVLFAMLSAQEALFGNDFTSWQSVGIGLHCVAVLLFLRLLLQFHRLAAPIASEDNRPRAWITERRLFLGLGFCNLLYARTYHLAALPRRIRTGQLLSIPLAVRVTPWRPRPS
jgi:hypothetical protein